MISNPRGHFWVDETQPEQRDAGNTYMRCSRCSLYVRAQETITTIRSFDEVEGRHMHVRTFSRITELPSGELAVTTPVHSLESLVCSG